MNKLYFVLCLLVVGGCASSPVNISQTPVTLPSVERNYVDEALEACDNYRARREHTSIVLPDGTPLRCF